MKESSIFLEPFLSAQTGNPSVILPEFDPDTREFLGRNTIQKKKKESSILCVTFSSGQICLS